ncbi:hypothetical protein [Flavobacterium aestivum]|uniref:hypothetical protein n=1 Tax=Flavobacterium aestivum TaxID=3003257 RepID=UPI0024830EA3|nr:hypothetical protein [Flavobacterium aestivum]
MKKCIFIIFLVSIFSSCVEKKEIISNEVINKLSEGSYKIPSKFGNLDLFVLSKNQQIIITNADYLNYVYNYHYKSIFKSYNEFLSDVLNHNIQLNTTVFDNIPYKIFKLSKTIENEYKDQTFETFFKKYSKKEDFEKGSYILNISKETSPNEIMTISYYFYLNGYQVVRNDYLPKYLVIKREEIMGIE